jgi:hypothetical protein
MADVTIPTTLDSLLEPLSRCLDAASAKRVIGLRVAPSVDARMAVLAEKANDGTLGEDERAEYEALINAADLISILKLKARRRLEPSAT